LDELIHNVIPELRALVMVARAALRKAPVARNLRHRIPVKLTTVSSFQRGRRRYG
jgi:hypothetical protein